MKEQVFAVEVKGEVVAYVATNSKAKAISKAVLVYGKNARVFKRHGKPNDAKILSA